MGTKMAKSISDTATHQIKSLLEYKAIRFGAIFKTNTEVGSTVTCSVCSSKTGPSGLSALGVRRWDCSVCGETHDRDINAAVNILASVRGIERHQTGISVL